MELGSNNLKFKFIFDIINSKGKV